jgi:hypothetical protein
VQRFEAALVKGIANYVCLDRLITARAEGSLDTQQWKWHRLLEMLNDPARAFRGDFETLGFHLPDDLRSSISGRFGEPSGMPCEYVNQLKLPH